MRQMLDDRSFIEPTKELAPLPDRPQPTQAEREAERKADRITLTDVRRQLAWTKEHVDHAIAAHGFPRPVGRATSMLHPIGEPIYSSSEIRRWHANFRAFAATVPTKF